jgi:natural product precursor
MKKINLDGLKNVLSPKEMKNVTGGSGVFYCWCGHDSFNVFADTCSEAISATKGLCGGSCFCSDYD